MIWLTWRQHRKHALFAVIGLAVLAAILIPTGLQMYNGLDETGLRDCVRAVGEADFVDADAFIPCEEAEQAFEHAYGSRTILTVLLVFLPLLPGMFWGATLVAREVEHGTHRLVWTQSVSRLRWLLVKGSLVTAGTAILAAAYALLASWWIAPLVTGNGGRLQFPAFDVTGLAPVGYSVFAVVLGILVGAASRRVLPAMAITLVGFGVARAAVAAFRSRFQAPSEAQYPVSSEISPNRFSGDWVLSEEVYAADGTFLGNGISSCTGGPPPAASAEEALMCNGYNAFTYQPGDRFWPFQYLETGIFAALTVALAVLAVYLVRRRIT